MNHDEQKQVLLHAVTQLKQFTDDWNGYGATGVTQAAIEGAVSFIESVPSDQCLPDWALPSAGGTVILKWKDEKGMLLIEFDGTHLHLASEYEDVEPVYRDNIPPHDALTHVPATEIAENSHQIAEKK